MDLEYGMSLKEGRAEPYTVHYETGRNGFREWGSLRSEKPKVMFVGDSYTQAVEVSNADAFFSIVGDSLESEVFAIGNAGWGTTQEMLIIEQYLDSIHPDLIVLQVCDNDLIDNYAELEYTSNYKVGLRRPYLTLKGDIVQRRPVPKWIELMDKSRFLSIIRKKTHNTFGKSQTESAELRISRDKREFEEYDKSLKVTSLAAARIKKVVGDIPVLVFSASPHDPQLADLRSVFEENDFPFTQKPCKAVWVADDKGLPAHSHDGYHWSQLGNQIVAQELIKEIRPLLANE